MITSVLCLATAVFFEARDQSTEGQYAVAEVVMNRVESPRWPDDTCGVVYQSRQFSFTHDGSTEGMSPEELNFLDGIAWEKALNIATSVLEGEIIGLKSTHYHTTYVLPYWAKHYHADGRIGDHLFYTAPAGK